MAKPKFWMGLSTVGILMTTLMLAGQQLGNVNAGLINDVLQLSTTKVGRIDSDEVEGSAYADANGNLSDKAFWKMLEDSYKFCEQAVEQGSILLKNNEAKDGKKALPLAKDERKVTLFGRGSKNLYMRSGAGGAAPNEDYVVNLDEAFEKNGFEINRTVWNAYSKLSRQDLAKPSTNVEQSFTGLYTNAIKETFSDYSDAAIVTFVRIGTEDTDPGAGQLDLKNDEKELLKMIKESGEFKKTIVLINSPLAMSMDWVDVEEYGIDAVVYMGVPGYYGAGGIVHVLMGEDADGNLVNPSGHVTTSFAASASSSPAYVNFGQSSMAAYDEGVYVGYKYYETRYADCVLGQGNANGTAGTFINKSGWNYADEMAYPFGFGLSYTEFEQTIKNVEYNEERDQYDVTVEVENKGDLAGKASLQVYVSAPYTQFDKTNKLGKSAIALMGYDKVDVGAHKKVEKTISFDRYFLTTYDYVVNKTYILEGGTYYFAVGNGAHEALNNVLYHQNNDLDLYDHLGEKYNGNDNAVKEVEIVEDLVTYKTSHYDETVTVTNQFDDADFNYMANKNNKTNLVHEYLSRTDWQGTWPKKQSTNPATDADLNMSQYYKKASDCPSYKAADGIEYNVPFVDNDGNQVKLTFNDMAKVPLEGEVEKGKYAGYDGADLWDKFIKQMNLDDLAISVSDNRGILDVKKVLKKGNSVAEGPEGLLARFKYGDKRWATGFPTGPTYVSTWDHNMQKKFGGFYGEEALFAGVAAVNAPGMNINRTPYGSRASEYMSEDGIMNYYSAANVVGEARKKGLVMNVKHCFLNNQETGRQRISTYCTEQAIREIYLKPFEGALTKGRGLGIMTSYNRIGARYAACHAPLMNNVMRGEWKYRGLIIDDALTGSNTSDYSNGPAMLHCGTDLFCLDGNRGSQLKSAINGSADDLVLLRDMQRANKYVMYAMSRSWMGGVEVNENDIGKDPWWKTTITGLVIGFGSITAILFGLYVFTEVKDKIKVVEE